MKKLKESMKEYGLKKNDIFLFAFHMLIVALNIAIGEYAIAVLWLFIGVIMVLNSSLVGMYRRLTDEQGKLIEKLFKANGELWKEIRRLSTPATEKSKTGKRQTKKQ